MSVRESDRVREREWGVGGVGSGEWGLMEHVREQKKSEKEHVQERAGRWTDGSGEQGRIETQRRREQIRPRKKENKIKAD